MPEHISQLAKIPLDQIHVDDEENCRGKIAPVDVFELAADIKEHGQHEPVIVRLTHKEDSTTHKPIVQPYILVAGFCRFLAHRVNKSTEIEAVIRDMSPLEAVIVNFSENLKRKDLNIMQEANTIRRLVRMGLERKSICRIIGKSDGWVQPRMYLIQMEPEIQRLAQAGILSAENIRQLWSYKGKEERLAVVKQIRARRERGYIGSIKIKPPKDPKRNRANIKKARDRGEINNFLDHLLDRGVPFGLHTRMLAWASGQITDMEICVDLQSFFNDITKLFRNRKLVDGAEFLTSFVISEEEFKAITDRWGLEQHFFYQVPQRGIPDMSEVPEQ
jgi:ParB/RepB/Spo0J family partition protein